MRRWRGAPRAFHLHVRRERAIAHTGYTTSACIVLAFAREFTGLGYLEWNALSARHGLPWPGAKKCGFPGRVTTAFSAAGRNTRESSRLFSPSAFSLSFYPVSLLLLFLPLSPSLFYCAPVACSGWFLSLIK